MLGRFYVPGSANSERRVRALHAADRMHRAVGRLRRDLRELIRRDGQAQRRRGRGRVPRRRGRHQQILPVHLQDGPIVGPVLGRVRRGIPRLVGFVRGLSDGAGGEQAAWARPTAGVLPEMQRRCRCGCIWHCG